MFSYVLVSVLVFSTSSFAGESCPELDLNNFYQKLNEKGPVKKQLDLKFKIPETSIDVAKQRPNPQVNFEYMKGDEFGLDINAYTLSAQHIFELGDKRTKRIEKAKSQTLLGQKSIELNLYQYYVSKIKNFQRIGQLEILIHTIKEAISTFESLINKLEKRERLNPEEQISLSTLKLASNEYKTQLNDYNNEHELLVGEIEFSSNCNNPIVKYNTIDFHKIDASLTQGETGRGEIEKLKLRAAEANLEIEKSKGYSNLAIGPQFQYQQAGNDEFLSAGVVLSFSLPLFHTNDGGKAKARTEATYQRTITNNNLRLIEIRKTRLKKKFENSLKVFSEIPTIKMVEKKHHQIEKLFARGVVSMALSIEAHRQNIEFLKSRFETEQDLLDVIEEMIILTGNKELINKII